MKKLIRRRLRRRAASPASPPRRAIAEDEISIAHQSWPWLGIFGKYDEAALKRGFQVYHDVCSNCHSLKLVAYRDLGPASASPTTTSKRSPPRSRFPTTPMTPAT